MWTQRSGKLRLLLTFAVALLGAAGVRAATAYAECVDDAVPGAPTAAKIPAAVGLSKGMSFLFRVEPARSWHVEKATLLLHIADGPVPSAIEVGGQKPVAVQKKGQGWLLVELPAPVSGKLVSEPGTRLFVKARQSTATMHTRESKTYAPYVVIEGSPPQK